MFINSNLKLNLKRYMRIIYVKYKHRDTHWSVQARKKSATNKALEHFDDFYKTVYGNQWYSIRNGLLANNKFVAVVNNYSDNEQTVTKLENMGALNMRKLLSLEKESIQENKRKNYLKKVIELDKKLELQNNIFPKEVHLPLTNKTEAEEHSHIVQTPRSHSFTEALKNAEIDTSRIISPGTADFSSTLYEFVPATKLKGREDFIPETQYYRYYENTNEFSVATEKEYDLHFPDHLNVYCYEKSNNTAFEPPRRGSTGVLDYYLLDGGSLLPVLALGLKPGSSFLDMCSAPGGKAYIALQTLYPELVVCNDVDFSRIKRVDNVLKQYLYDLEEKWFSTGRLKVIQEDARELSWKGFDCILVDVPCTNDRLSVRENDNNWFKPKRTKERLQLPEIQAAILSNALKLVRVGGTVVYSTCSLSPIQNDGVVNMALKHIWDETHIQLIVKDLSAALIPLQCVFRFAEQNILKYGHLVVPYVPQNYGPMYFCKIQRIK